MFHKPIKTMARSTQPTLYEHNDAWDTNWLRVDDVHELYYEQYGKREGKPGKRYAPSLF